MGTKTIKDLPRTKIMFESGKEIQILNECFYYLKDEKELFFESKLNLNCEIRDKTMFTDSLKQQFKGKLLIGFFTEEMEQKYFFKNCFCIKVCLAISYQNLQEYVKYCFKYEDYKRKPDLKTKLIGAI